MKAYLRGTIILLAATQMVACTHWQGRLEGPGQAVADPTVDRVRLTLINSRRVEVRIAEIQGDTIYGTAGNSGPITCLEAGPLCSARYPIEQVGFVETPSFSLIRTVSLVAIPAALFAVVFLRDRGCPAGSFGPGC